MNSDPLTCLSACLLSSFYSSLFPDFVWLPPASCLLLHPQLFWGKTAASTALPCSSLFVLCEQTTYCSQAAFWSYRICPILSLLVRSKMHMYNVPLEHFEINVSSLYLGYLAFIHMQDLSSTSGCSHVKRCRRKEDKAKSNLNSKLVY